MVVLRNPHSVTQWTLFAIKVTKKQDRALTGFTLLVLKCLERMISETAYRRISINQHTV